MVNRTPLRKKNGPMGGGGPLQMEIEKPKSFKKSMLKLLKLLSPHKVTISIIIILTAVATSASFISPRILGDMTNQIVDDFISVQVFDAVTKNLPDGIKLPAGTTINDLPSIIETAAMSGQINLEDFPELTNLETNDLDNVPATQRDLISNLDLSERPLFNYSKLGEIALTLLALFIAATIINFICGWVLSGIIQRIVRRLRQDISEKINRLPIQYFDKHLYGDTLSRITNDVDTLGQSLNQSLSQALSSVVMLVGVIAMLISISWLMTIMAVAVVVVSSICVSIIAKNTQKHFRSVQDALGGMNGYIEESYAGHVVIKAYSAEERYEKKFNKHAWQIYASSWKSQFLSGLMMPLMSFIGNLGYVATVIMGGWLAINGRLSIGDIQAAIQYINQMQQPITQVAQIANLLQSTTAAAERIFEFLEETEESPDSSKSILPKTIAGAVEFDNVTFGYENSKKVIKNLSFSIKQGNKVAIVGPTGAGKTTVVNLLMRFYDPDSGTIKVDGHNTRDMKRSAVRAMFGMVLQDTWLMSGTIHDNIAYGDLTASDAAVRKAATSAHVDHFVRSLPNGYDTKIEENSDNISTGEKQLMTIARAMLADAPMLILDEATSSVDTRTEVLIQQAMEKLMKGRTSFVIAHRLSTIKNSDLILVMNDGKIIEHGTHSQLIKADGFYTQLYNSQFIDS